MSLPRYNVHNYTLEDSLVETRLNMIGLVVKGYVKTENMQYLVEALSVGDGQLSDKDYYYIVRIA